MIRGVNKLIIEVNNPESEYFERAIFFVKPGKSEISAVKLAGNAEEVMRKNAYVALAQKKMPRTRRGMGVLRLAAALFCAGGVGAFLYALIIHSLQR